MYEYAFDGTMKIGHDNICFHQEGSKLRLLTEVLSMHALGVNWHSRCWKSYVKLRYASLYSGDENAQLK